MNLDPGNIMLCPRAMSWALCDMRLGLGLDMLGYETGICWPGTDDEGAWLGKQIWGSASHGITLSTIGISLQLDHFCSLHWAPSQSWHLIPLAFPNLHYRFPYHLLGGDSTVVIAHVILHHILGVT
ncbi:hypothetical protein E2C01_029534 [Portunus trituberculatus]|uniref:Uncharacterized protein n=1 Tax=Portunus trituberculatus TaxID=210409 RepID=A0A5B7ES37_PORTR|nr:hypothetical protein [Portunus trituberculatus]